RLAALAAGGIDRAYAVLQVDQRIGARGTDEGARQQLVDEVVLHLLAHAAARAAALLLLHLGQAVGQHVVDHGRRQQPVLAADGEPDRVADAVRERLAVAAEGRDEAAR